MGFWARMFGGDKAAKSGATAPEDADAAKPETLAPKPAADGAPDRVQSTAQPAAEDVAQKAEEAPAAPEQPEAAEPPAQAIAPEEDEPEPEDEPDAPEPPPEPFPDAVEYKLTTYGAYPPEPQFQATKKVYRCASRDAAIAFLKTQAVTEPMFYVEVQTPEGPLGVDAEQRVFDGNGAFIEG